MDDRRNPYPATVVWEGNSLAIIRSFPAAVREDLGAELRRLQLGERPLNSRPMRSIGPGVFEIREQDERGWYRVIYRRIEHCLHVLHCFEKKSAKTSKRDLALAGVRLRKALKEYF